VARHAPLLSAVTLTAGLAAASPAAAQPVPVFSAETGLVNVAVTVEDAQGRPVDGLTARDFVVSEDGRRQRVEMCARMGEGGSPSTSLDVALLVDTSDSMLATLRRSQDVTVRFLASLPNAQEVIVVFFDQTQRVEHFDRERPEALFERVRTLPEGGNTAVRDAIAFSLRALSKSNGRSALVPQRAVKELDRLAQVTGGRLFKLPNESALPRVLDEIVAELRSQYVLGFTPETSGAPGRMRKISVKVPGRGKVVVRHRLGYRLQPS
jgi:hypothetical protein